MNPSIKKLTGIASKPSKKIIGLMSGTSLDGLDIALCEVSHSAKNTTVDLLRFETVPYDKKTRKLLAEIASVEQAALQDVCIMNARLGELHGELVLKALDKWSIKPTDIDCIASHGQTIYHAPKSRHRRKGMPNATLQIGDGDHIAMKTGILTISDFRQKHTAAGGEGAPMVSFVDRMLFSHETNDRVLLNIGGIANFTWLPAKNSPKQSPVTTDTGPGNTLIDAATREYFSMEYDEESRIAQKGIVDENLLTMLKQHPFFELSPPSTTGPEAFNLQWLRSTLAERGMDMPEPENLVATLTRFSAETIAEAIKSVAATTGAGDRAPVVYVSGGGIHNPLMMKWLDKLLPDCPVRNFKEIGFDPDAKEAVLFAVLANETLAGKGFGMGEDSEETGRVNFGKISLPQ